MTVLLSVSWDDAKKKRAIAVVAAILMSVSMVSVPPGRTAGTHSPITVIVQAIAGRIDDARHAVTSAGGAITDELGIIGGFAARVPADAVDGLDARAGIATVTRDASVHLNGFYDGYDPASDGGSMYTTERVIGARSMWANGPTGAGVDVALVDSGTVPVDGLRASGKVVNGPDFSSEAANPDLQNLDTFGHGTHMAGIIAGRDDAVVNVNDRRSVGNFIGVAPDSRVVSIKVADAQGGTDISRVISGIGWAVQHRQDNGFNIRVLNLSFGGVASGDPALDPLVRAVDIAWSSGIVVVVAAGNRGLDSGGVDTPGRSADVITVAADDPRGTLAVDDDTVPPWSSNGDGVRNPDLVAPGKSIVALRDPGSYIDTHNPMARVGSRFFRGSGTSASTAVVSGAAALLLQQRPAMTPNQVKALLVATASPLSGATSERQGAGLLDLRTAMTTATPPDTASPAPGDPLLPLAEVDPTAALPFAPWSNTWDGNSWSGNSWSGNSWSGNSWSGNSWSLDEGDG